MVIVVVKGELEIAPVGVPIPITIVSLCSSNVSSVTRTVKIARVRPAGIVTAEVSTV